VSAQLLEHRNSACGRVRLSKERTAEHDKSIGTDDECIFVPNRGRLRFAEREMPRERARRKV